LVKEDGGYLLLDDKTQIPVYVYPVCYK